MCTKLQSLNVALCTCCKELKSKFWSSFFWYTRYLGNLLRRKSFLRPEYIFLDIGTLNSQDTNELYFSVLKYFLLYRLGVFLIFLRAIALQTYSLLSVPIVLRVMSIVLLTYFRRF